MNYKYVAFLEIYVFDIRRTLVGNQIVDRSDVVGQALLKLHLHSPLNTWPQYIAQRQRQAKMANICVLRFGAAYIRDFTVTAIFW